MTTPLDFLSNSRMSSPYFVNIISATYGTPSHSVDVANILTQCIYYPPDHVNFMSVVIQIDKITDQIGNQVHTIPTGDPDPGVVKSLTVTYIAGTSPRDKSRRVTVSEGQAFIIPVVPNTSITILGAAWGNLDVTSHVQYMAITNQFTISASNSVFGDPMPGVVKVLVVVWQNSGGPHMNIVNENGSMTLSS